MSKLLVVGDLHLKDRLGYAEYFDDFREPERKEILDFIVQKSNECDGVVLLGDVFDQRNNSSRTVKELVEFLERFNKKIYIIAGNHEKSSDGRTALDFLKEIKGKDWKIITDRVETYDGLVFCPYFYYPELGTNNKDRATAEVMRRIKQHKGDALFLHHAISDTEDFGGINTNQYKEVVLDRKELGGMFKVVMGGHIHFPSVRQNVAVCGCVFCNKVGDDTKYLFFLNTKTSEITKTKIPGKRIIRINYKHKRDLEEISSPGVYKVFVSSDEDYNFVGSNVGTNDLIKIILVKEVKKIKTKLNITSGSRIFDLTLEELLELYAQKKGISYESLLGALNIIK